MRWSTMSPNSAASMRSASAMPTAVASPWPSGPVVVFDAGGMAVFGMAGGLRAELAEILRSRSSRHALIAGQMQQAIEQHRAVAGRQHEAVAVGPVADRRRRTSATCVNSTVAMSAAPSGRPGWPELAFSTASMASARMALAIRGVADSNSCRNFRPRGPRVFADMADVARVDNRSRPASQRADGTAPHLPLRRLRERRLAPWRGPSLSYTGKSFELSRTAASADSKAFALVLPFDRSQLQRNRPRHGAAGKRSAGGNPTDEPEKRLAGAQNKLRAALDGLDAALSPPCRAGSGDGRPKSAEFSAIQEDRSRLAQELEAATARLRALEARMAKPWRGWSAPAPPSAPCSPPTSPPIAAPRFRRKIDMAQAVVTIAGRTYRMNCDEGDEPHIEELALQVDGKIAELRGAFGEIGDQRIVVMAALTLADELFATRKKLSEKDAALASAREEAARFEIRRQEWADQAAATLEAAAEQVEAATKVLNRG